MTIPTDPTAGAANCWAPAGVLRSATDVETVELGPNRVAFPLSGEETGGRYSLTEFMMAPPPAPGPPPHLHENADEAIYVVAGTVEMALGEQRLTGTPGAVMLAPRGTLHALANPGPEPARMLIILSPPGYESFWREMAALRAQLGEPPDAETVRALQRKHHLATGEATRRFE